MTAKREIRKLNYYFDTKSLVNIAQKHLRMRIHTIEKPWSCQYCKSTFRHDASSNKPIWMLRKNILACLEHKERIHKDKKLYSCRDCCKRFKKAEPLRYQHDWREWTIFNQKFKCDECANVFMQKHHLITHKDKVHSNKLDYLHQERLSV